ncbi:4Fe-4S binding protein [Planctomycetota bacterium]|nr:4Fe-4S binding protein [Planctomycetota bacterium]
MQKVHLVYFSGSGTTKKTVRHIAKGMKEARKIREMHLEKWDEIEVIEHDMKKAENRQKKLRFVKDEIVILGMFTATKLFGVPEEIFACMEGEGTPLVGVVMFGNSYYGRGLKTMRREVEKKGFVMVGAGAFIGQNAVPSERGIAVGRPDEKDLDVQHKFGRAIYEKVCVRKDYAFKTKLKTDRPKGQGVFVPLKANLILAMPGKSLKLPSPFNAMSVSDECIACNKCAKQCPVGAIDFETREHDLKKCIGCFGCLNGCPVDAIAFTNWFMKKAMVSCETHCQARREPVTFLA